MCERTSGRQVLFSIIQRWWFLALLLVPQMLPPYASRGYSLSEWSALNQYVITHPIKPAVSWIYPLFQIIPLNLTILFFTIRSRITRIFYAFIGLSYGLIAFLQNVSISDRRGTAVCTGNLVTFLFLAVLWWREAIHPGSTVVEKKVVLWHCWPLLLALVAFWEPVNPGTLLPEFNPRYLFISGAGLSFCMVTPLYLAVLILRFPTVNRVLMACTAFTGLFMGAGNLILEFILIPAYWWIGCLHFPLVILSGYSLFLLFRESNRSGRSVMPQSIRPPVLDR